MELEYKGMERLKLRTARI